MRGGGVVRCGCGGGVGAGGGSVAVGGEGGIVRGAVDGAGEAHAHVYPHA